MEVKEEELTALLSEMSEPDEKSGEMVLEDETLVESDAISAMLFKSSEKNDALSTEDAAWADSCLAIGLEGLSDDMWTAMKEALLDTLSAQPTPSVELPVADIDDDIQEEHGGHAQVNVEMESAVIHDVQHLLPVDPEEEEDTSVDTVLGSQEDVDSSENIFKVWDLESPDEEDGLINQLKDLLLESKLKVPPSALNDLSIAANDKGIDELITGLADLSF